MDKEIEEKVSVSTIHLTALIKKEYQNNPSGIIKGYSLPGIPCDIVPKQAAKNLCIVDKDIKGTLYRNEIEDNDVNMNRWVLTAFMICYSVCNNLRVEFKDYNFKTFYVSSECFTEYRYRENKLWKYRRTGYEIPLLKVNIEW